MASATIQKGPGNLSDYVKNADGTKPPKSHNLVKQFECGVKTLEFHPTGGPTSKLDVWSRWLADAEEFLRGELRAEEETTRRGRIIRPDPIRSDSGFAEYMFDEDTHRSLSALITAAAPAVTMSNDEEFGPRPSPRQSANESTGDIEDYHYYLPRESQKPMEQHKQNGDSSDEYLFDNAHYLRTCELARTRKRSQQRCRHAQAKLTQHNRKRQRGRTNGTLDFKRKHRKQF